LVGTAHISSQSSALVSQVISSVQLDAVFLELDAKQIGLPPSAIRKALPSISVLSLLITPSYSLLFSPTLFTFLPNQKMNCVALSSLLLLSILNPLETV
jgi:hypothetical protein